MMSILKVPVLLYFVFLANTPLMAKTIATLNFEAPPFSGKVAEKEIQKLLFKGGIRTTLALPTYVSLLVDNKWVSGVVAKGTEVILVPNDENDYYSVLPIIGGLNVSRQQKASDYPSSPRIQLIWYSSRNDYDAIYSLIALDE